MKPLPETTRLKLREFSEDDAAFIVALLNSPGWLKYIGDKKISTIEQAKEYLRNGPMESYRINGYGLWLVELRGTGSSIGMCGIINRATLDHPDIGFAFLPEYIGQGYALEAADAVMKFAGNVLALPVILAITLPNNRSSIRLLEKLKMEFLELFHFPNSREELMLYSTKQD